jgi:hypothetical protein
VPTRIARLDEGRYDAVVLAAAGLRRLGLGARIASLLPLGPFLPAVAQGAMAIQVRADDPATLGWVRPLEHAATRIATGAERALLAALEGGCQVPVGALGEVVDASSAARRGLLARRPAHGERPARRRSGGARATGRETRRGSAGRGGAAILAEDAMSAVAKSPAPGVAVTRAEPANACFPAARARPRGRLARTRIRAADELLADALVRLELRLGHFTSAQAAAAAVHRVAAPPWRVAAVGPGTAAEPQAGGPVHRAGGARA